MQESGNYRSEIKKLKIANLQEQPITIPKARSN